MLRSRCTLKKLVAVNARVTPMQRGALEGTMLEPFLQYCDIVMERHLTLAYKVLGTMMEGVPNCREEGSILCF